jgi:hypothetical protein
VRVERAETFPNDFGNGAIRGQRHILDEPRHTYARLAQHHTGIRLEIAAQDLQQRRFSSAIAANDGNALAGIDLECDLVEQRKMAESDRNPVERD